MRWPWIESASWEVKSPSTFAREALWRWIFLAKWRIDSIETGRASMMMAVRRQSIDQHRCR